MATEGGFKFRAHDSIGAAAAEDDTDFLPKCFVGGDELRRLRDCSDPKRIVIGRTGSGKSALLLELGKKEDRAIFLNPQDLALSYLANSNILQFVQEIGVKVDIFFRLLWRHALIVEILRKHFQIHKKEHKSRFFNWFGSNRERDNRHARAREYLEKWGDKFWETTEVRVKELISNVEDEIRNNVGVHLDVIELGASEASKISDRVRVEIVQRAQEIVNKVQIKELSAILDLLNDVLDDKYKKYFVIIDQLDEDWVEDGLRVRLVRALIETCRDFRKVVNAKVVISLRSDLIARVFRTTRDAGFQEEKYSSLYLRLRWTKDKLLEVVDQRLSHLVRRRYEPRGKVFLRELLPKSIKTGRGKSDREEGVDYIVSRTMMRPRDIIAFMNSLILQADGRAEFSADVMKTAEGEYSRDRLKSLQTEWYDIYPELISVTSFLLSRRDSVVRVSDLFDRELEMVVEFPADRVSQGTFIGNALAKYHKSADALALAREIVTMWYSVGIIGIKLSAMQAPDWATLGQKAISQSEVQEDTKLYVHPCFWRVLGCQNIHSHYRPS